MEKSCSIGEMSNDESDSEEEDDDKCSDNSDEDLFNISSVRII